MGATESEEVLYEKYNEEIDEAMARIDMGAYSDHEDVEKEMESW